MAEGADQSKTEPPTQRRREEARQQGQVAVSAELMAGVLLLVGLLALQTSGHRLGGGLLNLATTSFMGLQERELDIARTQSIMIGFGSRSLEMLALFFGLLFASAFAIGALQVGLHFVPSLLTINWEKLSPVAGWNRIISQAAVLRGLAAVLKVMIVGVMAYWALHGRLTQFTLLGEGTLVTLSAQAWALAMRLSIAIASALVLLGVCDYFFHRWRLEQTLRMSRQELKDEIKREEGDPHMKARIRKMQREMAKKRMMADVPRATVVITNPTHLAIALRYDKGMAAPKLVAKGAGFVAKRIVEKARRHSVPVIERKPLAQAIFKSVRIGQDIPNALYYAVAEVLAYIYRLRNAV